MQLEVVYLDDEPDLCEFFSDEYDSEWIHVRTFTDPRQAIESVSAQPPDVIFIDYRLPGIRGDTVAQSISEKIPKYLVTGDIQVKTEYKFVEILSKLDFRARVHEILNGMVRKKSA